VQWLAAVSGSGLPSLGEKRFCNSQSLDTTHETLERLARDLLQIDREMRAEPERRAVFTLCQRGGRALTIACVENIARNHRACEAYGAGGFEACLADFFARIDEAGSSSSRARSLVRAPSWCASMGALGKHRRGASGPSPKWCRRVCAWSFDGVCRMPAPNDGLA
jgi:hypothetical protein